MDYLILSYLIHRQSTLDGSKHPQTADASEQPPTGQTSLFLIEKVSGRERSDISAPLSASMHRSPSNRAGLW